MSQNLYPIIGSDVGEGNSKDEVLDAGFEMGENTQPNQKQSLETNAPSNDGEKKNEEIKQQREVKNQSERNIKQKDEVLKIKSQQDDFREKAKKDLTDLARKFGFSDSLLDDGKAFNNSNTHERSNEWKELDNEESEIYKKEVVTDNENRKVEKINQKRMGLVLEQIFTDTLNLNDMLAKFASQIKQLSQTEKEQFKPEIFNHLKDEFQQFFINYETIMREVSPISYDDKENSITDESNNFKKKLCDQYEKSMGLNKDIDSETNYDAFLNQEVNKVGLKLDILAQEFRQSENKEIGNKENIDKNINGVFVGPKNKEAENSQNEISKSKNNDFNEFLETGKVDGINIGNETLIEEPKQSEETGHHFFDQDD